MCWTSVDDVLGHLYRSDRLITRILLDGEEPKPEQLDSIKRLTLADRTLFIETADSRQTAVDSLDEATTRLSQAEEFKTAAADLLRTNQWQAALLKIGECLQRWQDAQRTVVAVGKFFKVDLERLTIAGRPLSTIMSDFSTQLRQFQTALQNRDGVGLIDLLIYEGEQTATMWRNSLCTLRSMILPVPAVQSVA